MALKEKLMADMKEALKAREQGKLKLSVIRMALASIKNKEIELGTTLDDTGIQEVLAKEVKQRRDALGEYERAGRQDVVDKLNQEMEILQQYLPRQLSEDEVREILREIIEELGVQNQKDLGKVMKVAMSKLKGKADGRMVNQIAREMLD
ncbi:GatB/YqeY domain-containing protein [Calderihabitans maritimus]|uniref:Aspartyl/glutamyl-tRNA amidotransferase, subunit B n=1 Tax=Calderihabitans maritimus TaxID=1246530 RepID=A0A1Z5HVA3_9FIRM|nr:GatB/YqeY domain-containing protein [Calderihabitans maritimus]GAW93444.1 aspartyl/glutamyl-tRNA amidotransferase, subunit B [Calderihabitans maritimus]